MRALLAPLAWSAGANLPLPEGGIVAQPEGANLLTMAGPGTTSYSLSAAYPSWQAVAAPAVQPLDFARSSPGVGTLPDGYDIVFGGSQDGFATSAVTQYDPNTVTVVDGATNQTRPLRSMNVPRAELGWATDANHLDYAIGGQDNNGTPLSTMEVYKPTANTWTYAASLPQALYGESAVSDGAGHIDTFGGVGAGGAVTNVVYRYTIATNTWDQLASPMPVGLRDGAAVLAPNGLIYVIGGQTAAGASATVESYNPATNTWNVETSLPQPLSSAAAAVDSLGRIEVLGGYDANGNPLATTYVSQEFTQPDLAPTINSPPQTAGILNAGYAYQVASTGNPQATYSLAAAPAWMTINAGTGLISGTPTALGSYGVTVQASNAAGQGSQSFTVNVVLPTPAAPTGVTGTSLSTTTVGLSWNASTDPYVTSYDVYEQHFAHSPRGSGGSTYYVLVASGITSTSVTLAGSGTYSVTAVNSEGIQSPRSANVFVAVMSPPDLYVATTTSGADIASLTLSVGQTGQIYLIQEFANPAPTFSLVAGPSGIIVNPTTGLVTYTPSASDIGEQIVTFAASNAAGTSTYQFVYYVQALQPTVSVTGGTIAYDGNPHPDVAAAVGVDGATPVAGSFAFTYNGSPTPPTAAGTYAVVATFTSADPAYANAVATTTLTIDPATPLITVDGGTYAYDGNAHAAVATAVGVDGVTPVAGSFQITYNGDPTVPSAPGLYAVVATFTSNDPNYASAAATGDLIIDSPGTLAPALSLVDGSAPYDGNPHADSAAAVGTDGVTPVAGAFLVTYDGSPTPPTQAGSYAVVATFISSDMNDTNAAITGTLTISPVAPALVIDPTPFTYNGTAHAASVSALGVDGVTPVAGTFSVTYDGSATPPVDAGTYDVAVSFSSNDPDYLSATTTGTMTILPATPSVGLGNGGQWEFTYDGAPQTVTGSAVGIDGVTPINGSFTYEYFNEYGSNTQLFGPPLPGPPVDAGYYTFIEYFTSQDPNYTGGSFSWDLWINPASPTVTVASGPFTYNGSRQPAVVSAVGIDGVTPVAGSVTYVTYNGSTAVPNGAGSYAVFAEFTSADPNYYSATATGTFVVNKATPAFSKLSSPTVNVGTSTVTVSGHIAAGSVAPGGDDVAVTLDGVTQPATISSSGSFSTTFNIQGLSTGSYPITYEYLGDATHFNAAGTAGGTLTVRAAPSVVTGHAPQAVASGGSVTFSATASGYPAPTVQWQQSTNRAVFASSLGSPTTSAATLTVTSSHAAIPRSNSATVSPGRSATIAAATTDIDGASAASLAIDGTTPGQGGDPANGPPSPTPSARRRAAPQ